MATGDIALLEEYEFDTTNNTSNIDGKIGVRLANGRAEQTSLVVALSVFLKVLWAV